MYEQAVVAPNETCPSSAERDSHESVLNPNLKSCSCSMSDLRGRAFCANEGISDRHLIQSWPPVSLPGEAMLLKMIR